MSKSNFEKAADQVNYLVELARRKQEDPTLTWSEIARIYEARSGIRLTDEAIRSRVRRALKSEVAAEKPKEDDYQRFKDGHIEARTIANKDFSKMSSDEVLKELGYDPKSWDLSYLRISSWEKSGVLDSLYAIKYKVTPKETKEKSINYVEAAEELLKDFKPKAVKYPKVDWTENADMKKVLLLNQIELHLGKMADRIENGNEYSTEIALERFQEIIEQACKLAKSENVGQAVVVIGGDFFNSESNGRTARGTEIRNDHSFKHLYQKGLEAYVDLLESLRTTVPNVLVLLCEGNHARAMEYFMFKTLEAYYHDASGIAFMKSVKDTQGLKVGNTALFFNHGDADQKRLINSIPAEYPEIYGSTNFRYLFVGHFHKLETSNTENGLHFHRVPAPCENDNWTTQNRFGIGTIPSYELMIMHSDHGLDTSKFIYFN